MLQRPRPFRLRPRLARVWCSCHPQAARLPDRRYMGTLIIVPEIVGSLFGPQNTVHTPNFGDTSTRLSPRRALSPHKNAQHSEASGKIGEACFMLSAATLPLEVSDKPDLGSIRAVVSVSDVTAHQQIIGTYAFVPLHARCGLPIDSGQTQDNYLQPPISAHLSRKR